MSTPAKKPARKSAAAAAAAADPGDCVFATKEDIQEVENDISSIQKQAADVLQRLRTPRAARYTSHHDQADIEATLAKYGGGSTGPSPRDEGVNGLTDGSAPPTTESRTGLFTEREFINEPSADEAQPAVEEVNSPQPSQPQASSCPRSVPVPLALPMSPGSASKNPALLALRASRAVHFRNVHAKLTLRPPAGGAFAGRFYVKVELLGVQTRTAGAGATVERCGLVQVRWPECFRFPVAPGIAAVPQMVVTLKREGPTQGEVVVVGRPAVCPLSGVSEQPMLFEMNVGVGNVSASLFLEKQPPMKRQK